MNKVYITVSMWGGLFEDVSVNATDPDPDSKYPETCNESWDNGKKVFVRDLEM